jgi:hypothetical protein
VGCRGVGDVNHGTARFVDHTQLRVCNLVHTCVSFVQDNFFNSLIQYSSPKHSSTPSSSIIHILSLRFANDSSQIPIMFWQPEPEPSPTWIETIFRVLLVLVVTVLFVFLFEIVVILIFDLDASPDTITTPTPIKCKTSEPTLGSKAKQKKCDTSKLAPQLSETEAESATNTPIFTPPGSESEFLNPLDLVQELRAERAKSNLTEIKHLKTFANTHQPAKTRTSNRSLNQFTPSSPPTPVTQTDNSLVRSSVSISSLH